MKFEGTADHVATPDLAIAVDAAVALTLPENPRDVPLFERLAFPARSRRS